MAKRDSPKRIRDIRKFIKKKAEEDDTVFFRNGRSSRLATVSSEGLQQR